MSVRVMIKRKVPKDKRTDVIKLAMRLRVLASQEPGYISGETLVNVSDADDHLVISSWQSVDDWRSWEWSKERYEVQRKIDTLLGEDTTSYEIYHYPEKRRVKI